MFVAVAINFLVSLYILTVDMVLRNENYSTDSAIL